MIQLRQEPATAGKHPRERTVEEALAYGLIPVDKPPGPTSHEVSSFVKKVLGLKKTGHTGTLDADVSGVLLVLLENSCKAAKYLMGEGKKYVCLMELGGKVEKKGLEEALSHFKGKIYQTPPLESAVAKKLRIREIYELNILEIEKNLVLFECSCEAGFYLRKLCFDVGEVLGCGAKMRELRRMEAGGVGEEKAVSLQELSDAFWLWKEKNDGKELRKMIVPVEEVLALKRVVASDLALKSISTGANLAIPGIISLGEGIRAGEYVQVLTQKGELVCVARALMTSSMVAEKEHGLAFDVERVIHSFG
jgi:H/ACA ribonucleoprotein complex subunit 4